MAALARELSLQAPAVGLHHIVEDARVADSKRDFLCDRDEQKALFFNKASPLGFVENFQHADLLFARDQWHSIVAARVSEHAAPGKAVGVAQTLNNLGDFGMSDL